MKRYSLWDALIIHAAYHNWNPIGLILNDDWVEDIWYVHGPTYPGWRRFR
jgi:hypothetical protein